MFRVLTGAARERPARAVRIEARELIRQATDDLIALERAGASPERIDGVFRAFHTLKGSAGVVELPAMS